VRRWPTVGGGHQADRRRCATAAGIEVFVTGGSALVADQQIAGDRSVRVNEGDIFVVIITMLLLVYRFPSDHSAGAGDVVLI
jgi:uncharacterized membrane protein YdfJ with MMPL/SSD domain